MRWLIIGLVVSVGLNLFLAGLIVGGVGAARRSAEFRPAESQARFPLWRAGDDLPPEKRRAFRRMIREAVLETQDDIRGSRALRREAVAMLDAETYDAEAAVKAMSEARRREQAARSAVETAILRFAGGLDPAERRTLAGGLSRSMVGQLRDPRQRRGPPQGVTDGPNPGGAGPP